MRELLVVKKNGKEELFMNNKIINAVNKSCERVNIKLPDSTLCVLSKIIEEKARTNSNGLIYDIIHVSDLNDIIVESLRTINEKVAKAYYDYRNYKKEFSNILDTAYKKDRNI